MNIRLNSERGSILFWVVIVSLIIGISFTGLTVKLSGLFKSSKYRTDKLKADALAESGIADGFWRWLNDFEWQAKTKSSDFMQVKFRNNFYSLKSARKIFPEIFRLESSAKINSANSSAVQEFILMSPLIYSLFSNDRMFIGNDAVITGNIKAGGIVEISEKSQINGNILTAKHCLNYCKTKLNCFEKTLDYKFEIPDLKKIYNAPDVISINDYKIENMEFNNKIIFCRNGAELTSVRCINSILIVCGNLEILDNNFFSNQGNTPVIIVEKNLRISGKNNTIAGFVAAGSAADISGSLNLKGTLAAETIRLTGIVNIVYDKNIYNSGVSGFPVKYSKTQFSIR